MLKKTVIVVVASIFTTPFAAAAPTVKFKKVADENTEIPGGSGTFALFGCPAIYQWMVSNSYSVGAENRRFSKESTSMWMAHLTWSLI